MQQYIDLVKYVIINGDKKTDRTGTGTISCFGQQLCFNMQEGFPLLTTKKVLFESVVRELIWMLSGSTNVKDLHPCKIWDAWSNQEGELGPIYGSQWRKLSGYDNITGHGDLSKFEIDQISSVINSIKNNPDSRRHIVSAWNVAEIDEMALPPCHCFFQFNVAGEYLDLQLYQRSADLALGVPFNIASYALLLGIIANETNKIPRTFIHTFGDVHIYKNHVQGLCQQINRKPHPLPTVKINKKPIFELTLEDFELCGYTHEPFIKFPIAV